MKRSKNNSKNTIPARIMSIVLTASLYAGSAAALPAYAMDNDTGSASLQQSYSEEFPAEEAASPNAAGNYSTDDSGVPASNKAYDVDASSYEYDMETDSEEQPGLSEDNAVAQTETIDIEESSVTIARKKTVQLSLISFPEDELIWSSSDPSVAEVTEGGLVTGRKVGTAVIKCESAYNAEIYDTCDVHVKLGNNEAVFLAHKGYSAIAPENTLPAIREAVWAGFDGVELDVYELKKEKSKKYKPFILISHDNTLKRLTGKKGKIENLKHKNYKKYTIKYHVNGIETYGVQTFPTIEQAMKTAWKEADKAGKKNFIIELDIKQKTISKSAVKKIIRLAGKHRVRINSPHYQVIKKFKKYRKYKTTELWMFKDAKTVAKRKAFIGQAKKLGVKGVSMPPECWNSKLIKYARKKHLKMATRTNDSAKAQKLIDKGFERVCTGKKMFTD